VSALAGEYFARWIPGTRPGMTPQCVVRSPTTHSAVIPARVAGIQGAARSDDHSRTNTGQRGVQINPMRVRALNQIDLPRARPFLHGLFALNGLADIRKFLEPDELVHLVFACKARSFSGSVPLDTRHKTVRDADIEGSPRSAGKDVDPIAAHSALRNRPTEFAPRWIAGTSPAMTSEDVDRLRTIHSAVIPALVAGIQGAACSLDRGPADSRQRGRQNAGRFAARASLRTRAAETAPRWIPGTRPGMTPQCVVRSPTTHSAVIPALVAGIQGAARSDDHSRTNTGQRGVRNVDPVAAHGALRNRPAETAPRWIPGTRPGMTPRCVGRSPRPGTRSVGTCCAPLVIPATGSFAMETIS
jgi:hypothetical protein